MVRAYRIASQLRFDERYRLLREKYGPGEDRSQGNRIRELVPDRKVGFLPGIPVYVVWMDATM